MNTRLICRRFASKCLLVGVVLALCLAWSEVRAGSGSQPADPVSFKYDRVNLPGGTEMLALSYFTDSNHNYVVEHRAALESGTCARWQPLPDAPHNYGIVWTTLLEPQEYFRLRRIDHPRSPLYALLANDTGEEEYDTVTSDPAVTGLALQFASNTVLEAALDEPSGPFVTVTNLGYPRYFHIDSNGLAAINGGPLADGPHLLYLRSEGPEASASFSLSFVLDTTPPPLSLDLDPGSDSPPLGDNATTVNPITLTGQTEPGLSVELLPGGRQVVAGASGQFTFDGVFLGVGSNQFQVRTLDAACNEALVVRVIVRPNGPG